ncbi:unnamed protein product [Cuscuta epithymum]|uniref:Uncharacterized protein n=1 Tax=Cuscuta epithymum TaxID=186058 RepID=A0AAV0CZ61_9ASTE|nr:unnamed protein product [Cuscuta epithymum]
MATNVLCSVIGPSAPSYPAHVQLVHPFQDGDERLMQCDRPLSAIVPNSRSARPSLPGWRRTSCAVRSAPQRHRTQLTFSSSIPSRVATNVLCITIGFSAPSCLFHVRIAPFPSRMATNVLCSAIGPSAPSYPAHVQLVHPFQGGDERLMHHDRLLSAIVSLSRSDRPIPFQDGDERLMQCDRPLSAIVPSSRSARPSLPGWQRTSYAVRSAPQRHRTQLTFSSSIPSRVATNVLCITIGFSPPSCLFHVRIAPFPSRMATNVLCSAIGPSAPSYPAHVQLVHPFQGGDERLMHHDRLLSAIVSLSRSDRPIPFQDGDERLMQCDRPLSAIVPSSRSARPSLPGWRRTSYASRSASQSHRVSFTFGSPHSLQDGDERLMQCDRPLSAIVPGFTVRLAHTLRDGDDRLMQHDRLLSAIVSLSRSGRPLLPGWRRTSLMQHDQRPSAIVSGSR